MGFYTLESKKSPIHFSISNCLCTGSTFLGKSPIPGLRGVQVRSCFHSVALSGVPSVGQERVEQ